MAKLLFTIYNFTKRYNYLKVTSLYILVNGTAPLPYPDDTQCLYLFVKHVSNEAQKHLQGISDPDKEKFDAWCKFTCRLQAG